MKFYAIHELSYINKFKDKEYLENDLKESYFYSNDINFKRAYDWLIGQMKKRLPNYDGKNLLWLWTKKPDWNKKDCFWDIDDINKDFVLLEIDLPVEKVLLSDFSSWHFILNNWTIEFYDGENIDKVESWNRIFYFKLLKEKGNYCSDMDTIQGTTGKIPMKNIKIIDTIYVTESLLKL